MILAVLIATFAAGIILASIGLLTDDRRYVIAGGAAVATHFLIAFATIARHAREPEEELIDTSKEGEIE